MKYSFSIEKRKKKIGEFIIYLFGFLFDFSFRSKNLSNFFWIFQHFAGFIGATITLSLFSLPIKKHLTFVRIVILCLNLLVHRKVKISLGTMNIHDEYSHRVNLRVNLLNISLLLKQGDLYLYVITFLV